ncbi:hypothetical protein [Yersinia pseudotuberculosis]
MKELNSFTVERLEELSTKENIPEVAALARIALAAKRAEPVAWEVKGILCHSKEEADSYVGEPVPLYEAPQLNSPEIPEGWKLVPIEPTRQMMSQGHFAMGGTDRGKFMRIYQAMLAAAPEKENG